MATKPDDALEGVPARVWTRLADLANKYKSDDQDKIDAGAFKKLYSDSIENFHKDPKWVTVVEGSDTSESGVIDQIVGPWDLTVVDSVTVGVKGTYSPQSDGTWTISLTLALKVTGRVVWETTYSLSPENYYVRLQPNVGIAKADVTIGLYGQKRCLQVSGNACYWWFAYRCVDFNQTLLCFM
ncbi:hypothetical protein [Goodfellowiella coeruleoviolacea]|uniref:Uncharacterized protein n=1 Tax=Goodfellowiella coeruleoviolacea TaxID=334858 RepID=A0AAE3GKL3_9PSEU|nr:hypothetical protein [Goodfellowiella coeruleoviolacea]MCP2169109.1 hypothetical protein [Goodfellowiella coeruleoviolacea]